MPKYFNRYTLSIGILLAAVVFSPGQGTSRAMGALHDFAHAPIFGCVALLILFWVRSRRPGISIAAEYLIAFASAVLLGLATEVAQTFTAGDPSWFDLRTDALGAAAFCAVFAAFDRRIAPVAFRILAATAGVALLTHHCVPLTRVAFAYAHRNRAFPMLFDARASRADSFTVPIRAELRYTVLPPRFATQLNEQALHVRLGAGPWLGVHFEEPYPDWSAFRTLKLDLVNPGTASLNLVIRVHDRAHDWSFADRFNRRFVLAPHTRLTYAVPIAEVERSPATRRLDTRRIANLALFTEGTNAGRDFYVSNVWLE